MAECDRALGDCWFDNREAGVPARCCCIAALLTFAVVMKLNSKVE
jgi:hypothetical protein